MNIRKIQKLQKLYLSHRNVESMSLVECPSNRIKNHLQGVVSDKCTMFPRTHDMYFFCMFFFFFVTNHYIKENLGQFNELIEKYYTLKPKVYFVGI